MQNNVLCLYLSLNNYKCCINYHELLQNNNDYIFTKWKSPIIFKIHCTRAYMPRDDFKLLYATFWCNVNIYIYTVYNISSFVSPSSVSLVWLHRCYFVQFCGLWRWHGAKFIFWWKCENRMEMALFLLCVVSERISSMYWQRKLT